jgi:hypothetical protein
MNIWQGKFPTLNTAEDGYNTTAPVDSFGPQVSEQTHADLLFRCSSADTTDAKYELCQ